MHINSVFKISDMLSLALHSMVYIAGRNPELVSVKEIAGVTGCSVNHLAKVMQRLTRAGLLHSVRGPKGGFTLVRKPEDISFMQIYQAIEGEPAVKGCPLADSNCPFNKCIFGDTVDNINRQFIDYLEDTTLDRFTDL